MSPKSPNETQKKPLGKSKFIILILIVLAFLIFALLAVRELNNEEVTQETKEESLKEPLFKKEGELVFLKTSSSDTIQKIDIEVADNDDERAQGLMYRKSMPESNGMLFVFQKAEPQSFWMKNTIIPLDIIYVGEDRKIVSIQKFAVPFSEQSLPSNGNAMFVVEVNAGYCDKYKIGPDNFITFKTQK